MRHKFKHIIKKVKETSLSSEEKDRIKITLLEHIDSHPLVAGSGSFEIPKKISLAGWMGVYYPGKKFLTHSLFAVLIIFVTGASFASSNALPGNILYPVKIFNEKVGLLLSPDDETETELLVSYATNRLEEAESLYVKGKLDQKTEQRLATSFEKNSSKANKSLIDLSLKDKSAGDEEVLRFKAGLSRHQKIMDNLYEYNKESVSDNILVTEIDKSIKNLDSSFVILNQPTRAKENSNSSKNEWRKKEKSENLNSKLPTKEKDIFLSPEDASSTEAVLLMSESDISINETEETESDKVEERSDITNKNTNDSNKEDGDTAVSVPNIKVEARVDIKSGVDSIRTGL